MDISTLRRKLKIPLKKVCKIFGQFTKSAYLCNANEKNANAKIAQLVEHDLAKVGVAGSSPVFRSKKREH